MKTIASAKENMALLSQEQLTQAAFGTLCQAFALRLLERAGYEDGLYQQVALEFLEEGQESPPPVENVFNIDLSIVLESLRKEEKEHRQEKQAAEKLLTQVLQLQEQVSAQTRDEKAGTEQRFLTVQLYPATLWQQTVYAETLLRGGAAPENAVTPLTALSGHQGQRLAVPSRNGRNAGNRVQAANVQLPVQAIMAWRRSHPNGAEPAAPGRTGRRMTWRSAPPGQAVPSQDGDRMASISRTSGASPVPTDRQTGGYALPSEPLTYRAEQQGEGQSTLSPADRQLAQTVSDAVNRALQHSCPEDARLSRPEREAAQASTEQTRTPTEGRQRHGQPETAPSHEPASGQSTPRPGSQSLSTPAQSAGERREQQGQRTRQKLREQQSRQGRADNAAEDARTQPSAALPSQGASAPVGRENRAAKPETRREEARDTAGQTAANAAPEGAGTDQRPLSSGTVSAAERQTGGAMPLLHQSGMSWRGTGALEEGVSAAPWHGVGQRILPQRGSLGTGDAQPERPAGQTSADWLPLEPLELAQPDGSTALGEDAVNRAARESLTPPLRGEQTAGSAGRKDTDEEISRRRENRPGGESTLPGERERAAAPDRSPLGSARQGVAPVSRDVRVTGSGALGNTQETAQPLRREIYSGEMLTYSTIEGQTRQQNAQERAGTAELANSDQPPRTVQTSAGEAHRNQPTQPPAAEPRHPRTAQTATGEVQRNQLAHPPAAELHHPWTAQTATGEVQQNRQTQPSAAEPRHPRTAQTATGEVQQNRQTQPPAAELHHPRTAQTATEEVPQNRQTQPPAAELHHPRTAQTVTGEVQQNRQTQPPAAELHHPRTVQTATGEVQQNRQTQPAAAEMHHPRTAQTVTGEVPQNRQTQPPAAEMHHPRTAQTVTGEVPQNRQTQPSAAELHHPRTVQTATGEVQQNRQTQPAAAELHHPRTAQTVTGEVQQNRQTQPAAAELHHPRTAQTVTGEVPQNRQTQPHPGGIPIVNPMMGTLGERAMETLHGQPTGEARSPWQRQPGDFAESGNEPLIHPSESADGSTLPPFSAREGLPPTARPWAAFSRTEAEWRTGAAGTGAPLAQDMANGPDGNTTAPEKPAYQVPFDLRGETLTLRTEGERREETADAPGRSAADARQSKSHGGEAHRNLRSPLPGRAESGEPERGLVQTSRSAGNLHPATANGVHPTEPAELFVRRSQQSLTQPPAAAPVLREIRTTRTEPGIPSLRGEGAAQIAPEGKETLARFTAEGDRLPTAVAMEYDTSSRRATEALGGEESQISARRTDGGSGESWQTATAARGASMPTTTPGAQPHGQGETASARRLPSAYETGGLGTLRRQPLAVQRTMGVSGFSGNAPVGAAGAPQGAAPAAGQPVGRPGFPPEELLSHPGDRSLAGSAPPDIHSDGSTPAAPADGRQETPLSRRTPGTQTLPQQPVGRGSWPEQVELSYLPQQSSVEQPRSAPPSAPPAMDSEYVRSLPGWAQNFLKEGRPEAETAGSGPQMGVARSIAALPGGDSAAGAGDMDCAPGQPPPCGDHLPAKGGAAGKDGADRTDERRRAAAHRRQGLSDDRGANPPGAQAAGPVSEEVERGCMWGHQIQTC